MGFTELDVGGLGTVMSDSAIQYRSEAFQGECLRFELAAYDFNKYGCDIAYRISERDSGRLVALAKSGLVFFNYAERKVQSRPACFSEALDKLGSD
jgi:4-hydroxybenzoyl-CoA thioesterase